MKGERFYKIVIAILVILNLSTLAFFWFNRPPVPPHPEEHPLSEMLGLMGINKQKVDELEKEHHILKKKLVKKDMELHEQMYILIGEEADYYSILNDINSNKSDIEKMTFEFFDEVASYCNDDQKMELRRFVHTAFEQLRPPRK